MLTICIATLGQRGELLSRLLAGLMPQVDVAAGRVKVLAYWDCGESDLASKRQALVEAVDTEYICFVDDDDTVTDDYVSSILEALESRPDFVGLWMKVWKDGREHRLAELSLKYDHWFDGPEHYCRDITHENPMRTDIVRTVDFRDKPPGHPEDTPWSAKLRGKVKTEVMIDRVLYHYWWVPSKSAWGVNGNRVLPTAGRGKPWERVEVDSPHFRYLDVEPAGPTWTILIPTLGQRRDSFERLLDHLLPQVDEAGGRVWVLAYWNNGESGLPTIRQRLVEAVETEYLSFVDDDDMVDDRYVADILGALQSRPDYVGFNVQCYTDGEPQGIAYHSLEHRRWRQAMDGRLLRDISHINPMRSRFAKAANFRVAGVGQAEDRIWAQQLRGKLRSEVVIDRVMYHYYFSRTATAWQRGHLRRIVRDGWEPARPQSPWFYYHPQCAAQEVPVG